MHPLAGFFYCHWQDFLMALMRALGQCTHKTLFAF